MEFLAYLFTFFTLAYALWRAIDCYKENHLFFCSLYVTLYFIGCLSLAIEESLKAVFST